MKVVQETLGLSSITIAADTYTSVLPSLPANPPKMSPPSSAPPGSLRQRPVGGAKRRALYASPWQKRPQARSAGRRLR